MFDEVSFVLQELSVGERAALHHLSLLFSCSKCVITTQKIYFVKFFQRRDMAEIEDVHPYLSSD